ncbi:uncharacterized protein LOC131245303 isoform X2 [Magnolia sinica]|uniref:uncharacterized protein LOC131245303 isoform X2 n=1 Tax=Magnolia sinica TaxID=86752 RepID=UPI00265B14AE|nr:uncharacterized protein LOC131245303 isoform X2 [Magnolia sinica]
MGRGKFKGKPTGRRHFSTPEEMLAGTSTRPRTFKQEVAEDEEEEESEEEETEIEKTTDLSRREREEIEKQKAHERFMRLQEQGKTEQSRKDLERLSLIRQQRADAAKKREEVKAAKEQKKAETRK